MLPLDVIMFNSEAINDLYMHISTNTIVKCCLFSCLLLLCVLLLLFLVVFFLLLFVVVVVIQK